MSENERRSEPTDRSDPADGASPTDEELLRVWDELEPQTPSTAFTARMNALIATLRRSGPAVQAPTPSDGGTDDLGACLVDLRERCKLTVRVLREHLRI